MTGPQHYRQAEHLLAASERMLEALPGSPDPEGTTLLADSIAVQAQVHATLALAAATAHDTASRFIGDDHVNAWAATWRTPPPRCDETDRLGQRCTRSAFHAGVHSIPVTS